MTEWSGRCPCRHRHRSREAVLAMQPSCALGRGHPSVHMGPVTPLDWKAPVELRAFDLDDPKHARGLRADVAVE